ncbi:MAG: flagella basal body P-ring formation protein FlgA [Phycisphaerae bacterium]|nr:flagella basal body P-ring formation protein FlgA [Phycisphaerae bacterium]
MSSLQRILIILVTGIATLAATGSAFADRIELRRSIRRPFADQPVRLGDVARLEGEHADGFRRLVVLPAGAGTDRVARVTIGEIRELLEDAGIEWSRVELSGGSVAVRPAASGRSSSGGANSPSAPASRHAAVDAGSGSGFRPVGEWRNRPEGTLERQIAELILNEVGVLESDPDRLFLEVDRTVLELSASDAIEIRASVVDDHRTDVERPWDSVLLRIKERRPGGGWRSLHCRVNIGVMRIVPVAARDIRKGRRIEENERDIRIEARVVRPSETILDPSAIAGRKARLGVSAGDPILSSVLEPEKIVDRGAMIMIRSVIDGHEFSCLVECLQDGCIGDVVKCRTTSGESMLARVVGPNLAEVKSIL